MCDLPPGPVAVVAATLRQIASWGKARPATDDEWRYLADQVAALDHRWCCPMCQEVTCDTDCPLASARGADEATNG
jgi:hypothetical protein